MTRQQVLDKVGRERSWKLASTVIAMLAAMAAKRLMGAGYRAIRRDTDPKTPFDPTDTRFSWPEAVLWAAAAGIGLGITKIVSTRLTAIGWRAATGTQTPAVEQRSVP